MSDLYHFTTIDTLLDYIIPEMRLRLGKLHNSNDPYETKRFTYSLTQTIEDKSEELNNTINYERYRMFSDFFEEKVSFICFCNEYDSSLTKHRMWAQYGGNNEGCCIVLDKQKFNETINQKYKLFCDEAPPKYMPRDTMISRKVKYEKTVKRVYETSILSNDNIENRIDLSNQFLDFISANYEDILFSKRKDWEGEQEYRYVAIHYSEKELYLDILNSIKEIIFGPNTSNDSIVKTYRKIMNTLVEKQTDIKISFYRIALDIDNVVKIDLSKILEKLEFLRSKACNSLYKDITSELKKSNEDFKKGIDSINDFIRIFLSTDIPIIDLTIILSQDSIDNICQIIDQY